MFTESNKTTSDLLSQEQANVTLVDKLEVA
jgi:hypothetical protein